MATAATVLAHQGGWDEILMILLPIGLFVFLLRLASNRAAAQHHPPPSSTDQPHRGDPPNT